MNVYDITFGLKDGCTATTTRTAIIMSPIIINIMIVIKIDWKHQLLFIICSD